MPEIIIEQMNQRYRWLVKVNGSKYASGLEDTITEAALQAEKILQEVNDGK